MGTEIYQQLRRHVNEFGWGYPATTTGVELRFLERVFSEEEAETYMHLTANLACELCVDRCPMRAISLSAESVAAVDRERCIGCGLCVSACPIEAMELATKSQRQEPGFTSQFMRSSRDIESTIR